MVRVCPTLKDMFFIIIPCTEKRGEGREYSTLLCGETTGFYKIQLLLWLYAKEKKTFTSSSLSELSNPPKITKHVFHIKFTLEDWSKIPDLFFSPLTTPIFLYADFGRG